MLALTIKGLVARKLRLLATAIAIALGVAFMSGTFVFTDTVGKTFDSVLAEANRGVDAYVRAPSDIPLGYGESGPRLDSSIASTIETVPGVDKVALRINGYAQLVDKLGEPVGDVSQLPAFGTNWTTVDELNPYRLASGRGPRRDTEIVVDKASADRAGYRPGDIATVLTKGAPAQFTIVGIARFGRAKSPAGATAVLFTDTVAAKLLGSPEQADAIAVTADKSVSQEKLVAAITTLLGVSREDIEVITGTSLIAQEQAALAENFVEFETISLVFALVAVFVAAFIINNTFSISVAQRSREMAMLRALGASRRQVKRSVLVEASVIGVVASALGLLSGIGVAAGLKTLVKSFGIDLPDGPSVVSPTAMGISFAIGLTVTVASAWLPSRRAAKIAPIQSMRELSIDRSAASVRRALIGALITGLGALALLAGLSAAEVSIVGAAAVAMFLGVAILSPMLASPFARSMAVLLRLRGVQGRLAACNAMRNPNRMARTASSLMVGVALVGFITVFAASAKASIEGSLATDFTGTHLVQSGGFDNSSGLSPNLAAALRSAEGVTAVSQSRISNAVIDGSATDMFFAFDSTTVDQVFRLGAVEGDLHSLGTDGIAISQKRSQEKLWTIGTKVPVTLPTGETAFTVEAIYSDGTDWVGQQFVDVRAFEANGLPDLDFKLYVDGDEAAIEKVSAAYASANVLDRAAFLKDRSSEIDSVLGLFYAMLVLAVVIALLGIANTMSLSVGERRKEIGLLRAVGMTRSQVRSTIRWESIIIAVYGTVLGLGIGVFFGWAIVQALADQGTAILRVPGASLAAVTAVAAVSGAVAAALPARRAARAQVLGAIAAA